MRKKKYIIILLGSLFIFNNAFADEITIFSDSSDMQRISSMSILEDKTGKLTFEKVILSNQFLKSEKAIPNLAVSSSSFWIKFQIKNASTSNLLALFLEAPTIDEVELYTLHQEGKIIGQRMGENNFFSKRKYNDPNYIFGINLPSGESRTYLLKVKSIEQMMVPLSVGTVERVQNIIADNNLIFGLYSGFILVMFLYNLFIYFTVRDNSYLYYIAYLLFIGLTQISLKGYTFKYLWPNSIWLTTHSVVILSSLAAIAGILFIRSFLLTEKYTPVLNRGMNILNGVFLLSILLSILDYGETSFKVMQLDTLFSSFYVLFIALRIAKKGYRPAKFFLLAWSILLGGAIIFVLKDFGVIPFNRYTSYTLQVASAMETILLSFALADRINIFKKEKEEAQAKELQERIEKQEILEKQTEVLRIKVKEATLELRETNIDLNETNKKLEETLVKLKAAQAELVQKQKMASLGQLAAGVAHEVNNPLNIINTSLDIMERDYKELQKCIEKFQSIEASVENIRDKVKEAQEFVKEEMEYEEITKEVENAMVRARRSVSRTATITQELKTFSKIDTEGFTTTQINHDLDAMLDMLNHVLGEIQIEKVYSELPKIKCNPQKLNQLYQNILTNAVETIEKKGLKGNGGKIKIETNIFEGNVVITFTDNGTGMSDEVLEKAFDPFFTTKGVQGKGLGLANVYGVINELNGKVEVDTKEGDGTSVRLIIPVEKEQIKL